jgi:ribosomal protein S18 acetylase RimI-like enzyme
VNVRPLTPRDADRVAAIARADEETLRGRASHIQSDEVRTWWTRLDFERDSWLFEADGRTLAAGWFHVWSDRAHAAGVVAQGAKGRGLGSQLADRYEARGREEGVERLHTFVLPEDASAVQLFTGRGYHEVRTFYEMAIELDGPPSPPVVAKGLKLDVVRESDARAFHAATMEAFADNWDFVGMPFDEWWEFRRGQQADERGPLWFVVRDGDRIAAVIRNEARRDSGFVGMLGVRKEWRGLGLGRALLHRTFDEFWRRGLTRVTLGVDAENPTGATKLYESVGMIVEGSSVTYEKTFA